MNLDIKQFANKGVEMHFWREKDLNEHHHNGYEFAICTQGKILQVKNKVEKSIITSNQAILIFPDDVHSLKSIDKKKIAIHINISVSKEFFKAICEDLGILGKSIGSLQRQITLTQSEMAFLSNNITSCFAKYDNNNIDSSISQIKMIAVQLITIFAMRGFEKPIELPTWLQEFLNKISNPECFNMEIFELYKISGYSQTTLSKYFRQYFNKSLSQYVIDIRLEYACNLLKTTDYSIIEIASRSGFSSISNFNSKFKKYTGTTPTKYRQNEQ